MALIKGTLLPVVVAVVVVVVVVIVVVVVVVGSWYPQQSCEASKAQGYPRINLVASGFR